MPDIREKPKFDKPKTLDRKARLPQKMGRQLKEKYIQEMKRTASDGDAEPESAGEYAVNRVEAGAREAVGTAEDGVHGSIDRFRHHQAKVKQEKRREQYSESSGPEHTTADYSDTPRPADPAAPDIHIAEPPPPEPQEYYSPTAHHERRPGESYPRARKHSGEIQEPQRRLWKERAAETQRERIREKSRNAHTGGADEPVPAGGKNASQIETRFDIRERRRAVIRERGTASGTGGKANAKRTVKTATAAPKVQRQTAAVTRRAAKQAEKRARQKAVKEAAKKTAQAAKVTGKAVARVVKAVGTAIAKGIGAIIAAGGGAVLLVLVLFIGAVAALAASPFGLFFAAEKNGPDTVSVAEAVSSVNSSFNAQLESLQDGEYDDIVLHGHAASWPEVLAVFAAKTAAADEGADVATLDAERVELLKGVFWDMTAISAEVVTTDYPDSNPNDNIDDSYSESVLHITITAKTAEQMRSFYSFTDYQNDALTELLAERAALSSLAGDLTITAVDLKALIASLPDDLAPERREVVKTACTLVGKVNYFWGGKSRVIGWDSRWGQIRKVTSPGSSSTGTYRPFGLDCSGFVDWVFYQVSDGEYIIGHNGGAASQHGYCTSTTWSAALPGDLVFYPGDEHVGIVGGRDEGGNLLIIHCASGYNNVVVTDANGFTSIGTPLYYP